MDKDGTPDKAKEDRRAAYKKYYAEHREEILARAKLRYAAKKAGVTLHFPRKLKTLEEKLAWMREYNRRYLQEHHDRILANARERRRQKAAESKLAREVAKNKLAREVAERRKTTNALEMSVYDALFGNVRTINSLYAVGIKTVGELVQKSKQDLLAIRGFGESSLNCVKRALESLGVSLCAAKPKQKQTLEEKRARAREYAREHAREKYRNDPEYRAKHAARMKRYYESHKAEYKERSRRYHETHREQWKKYYETQKQKRKADPELQERYRARQREYERRRTAKRKALREAAASKA